MEPNWESERQYLKAELEHLLSKGLISEEDKMKTLKAWGLDCDVRNMKVKEFEVSYLEKIPAGRFQSQAFGVAMRIQLESEDEQEITRELSRAFDKAKESVKFQIELATNGSDYEG